MDDTTELLVGITIGGLALFSFLGIIIIDDIIPWIEKRRAARKQKV